MFRINVVVEINVLMGILNSMSFSMIQAHSIHIFYKKLISVVVLISGGNFSSKKNKFGATFIRISREYLV